MSAPQRPRQPTQDELNAWISLCEYFAKSARQWPTGPRLVRPDDDVKGGISEAFDELAAYLRDLL